jgi:hypothetical protein
MGQELAALQGVLAEFDDVDEEGVIACRLGNRFLAVAVRSRRFVFQTSP